MAEHRERNRADQGLNTKVYMAVLIVAVLVLLGSIVFFVAIRGSKATPNANQPHPNSRVTVPGVLMPAVA